MSKCLFSGCLREAIDGALYCREHESIEVATEMRSLGGGGGEGGGTSGGGKTDKDVKRPEDWLDDRD